MTLKSDLRVKERERKNKHRNTILGNIALHLVSQDPQNTMSLCWQSILLSERQELA